MEIRKQKIDMVSGHRARFVSNKLLPPTRIEGIVEKMASEYKAKVDKEKAHRQSLMSTESTKSNAKQELAEMLARQSEQANANGTPDVDNFVVDAKARALLKPAVVKYGRGRLTSVHTAKIPLEDPWGTVGGR